VPYLEFTGPPASGKTSAATALLRDEPDLSPGRRSLQQDGIPTGLGRSGLPREGMAMWTRLLAGLPRDLALGLAFWRDTRSPYGAARMASLLIKSRAQARSPRRWVVDQGLQQHVLSALAEGLLSPQRARHWRDLCLREPWGPERTIALNASRQQLVSRVAGSAKHQGQCAGEAVAAYVDRYLRAAALIADPAATSAARRGEAQTAAPMPHPLPPGERAG
jgi:hypothetical protein